MEFIFGGGLNVSSMGRELLGMGPDEMSAAGVSSADATGLRVGDVIWG